MAGHARHRLAGRPVALAAHARQPDADRLQPRALGQAIHREARHGQAGFKDSHLQLNKDLAELDTWNETEIVKRAGRLALQAVELWKRPSLPPEVLADYRTQFKQEQGFDWSMAHEILSLIPEGKWTGYYYLGEAIGTSAQAVANHVSKCTVCAHPYRVLTWDGRIADGFAWTEPE